MNNSNYTIQSAVSEYTLVLNKATDLLIVYGFRGMSVIGTLFNITTIIVLRRNIFKGSFYEFLRSRCVCNILVCLICCFYKKLDSMCEGCEDDFVDIYINWVVFCLLLRVAFFASFIADILIVLNRLAMMFDRKNSFFYALSKRVNIFEF
jgi:hypothetical protein